MTDGPTAFSQEDPIDPAIEPAEKIGDDVAQGLAGDAAQEVAATAPGAEEAPPIATGFEEAAPEYAERASEEAARTPATLEAALPAAMPAPALAVPPPALPLAADLLAAERVNFAMLQNGVPLIERLSLVNEGAEALTDLHLALTIETAVAAIDVAEPWSQRLERLEPGATCALEPERFRLRGTVLATFTEAQRAHVVLIATAPGHAPFEQRWPVDLLAFDQWPGIAHYPELLAAFVTPNHPAVIEVLGAARCLLGQQSGHDALDGYQSGSQQRAARIGEASFLALAARDLGYINPPASFEAEGQRVRLADRVLRERFGSCLDLSLLLASCWEQSGLHPLLLLVEGHAMPALWTREAHLPEAAIDEVARIRNLVALGDIVPVESTLLTQAGSTFAQAVEVAEKKLQDPGALFYAVDLRSARRRGIRPLPLRTEGEASVIDPAAAEADAASELTTLDSVALADRDRLAREARAAAGSTKQDDRVTRWQTRLLDLSLNNRLIHFRSTGQTLGLIAPQLARVEDLLAQEKRFVLQPRREGTAAAEDAFLREQMEAGFLHSLETPAETQKRLLNLYRTARAAIEETGSNLLYLALGMLRWYESPTADTPRLAPLILLPVSLQRTSAAGGYRYALALADEPLRPNITLLEKLRTGFGLDVRGLDDLPEDETGLDVALVLRRFREAIRDMPRWEVEESAWLGLFSFSKFLMWRDLSENLGALRRNRLVQHLVDPTGLETGSPGFEARPFPQPEELDQRYRPGELLCTRDADATQLAAVAAAAEGRSFVLEGPPGTGKSQTIANIIADALGKGKRVLFVAEKMAALSVVRKRLEDDGLGASCLELHSTKASKKQVLAQLQQTLDAAPIGMPGDWEERCAELGRLREHLDRYVSGMHTERPSGESLYQVLGRIFRLDEGPRAPLPREAVAEVSQEELQRWRQAIAELAEAAKPVDPAGEHPLRGIELEAWDFSLGARAEAQLAAGSTALESFFASAEALLMTLKLDAAIWTKLTRRSWVALALLAQQTLQRPDPAPHRQLLWGAEAQSIAADLQALVAVGRERDALEAALLEAHRPALLDADPIALRQALEAAEGKFFLMRPFARRAISRQLQAYRQAAAPAPDLAAWRSVLDQLEEVQRATRRLAEAREAETLVGRGWKGGRADWDALAAQLRWSAQVRQSLAELARDPAAGPALPAWALALARPQEDALPDPAAAAALRSAAEALVRAWNGWQAAWEPVKQTLVTTGALAFGPLDRPEAAAEVAAVLTRWREHLDTLSDWCVWRRSRGLAVAAGLEALVAAYEAGSLQRVALGEAFERSFAEKWFEQVANRVDAVRGFNRHTHETTIDRFGQIDRTLLQRAQAVVGAQLSAAAPNAAPQGRPIAQSELGILRREIEKKSRHLPTRKLIEALPNLLPRLKPCFLMSPLSIAQYLDPAQPLFDLVVFDEASQIPVWDAVGAIARGREVIVVGDSKQLPPTNFFSAMGLDEADSAEEIAVEDMESILKECNAAGVPALLLGWHYRSRHESLIAFSNRQYYENRLFTFPSPQDRSEDLGVTLTEVAGVFDRGGSRTNRIEAEAVVARVVELLTASEKPDSIGVVTFNQAQQTLIEDLLDAARREQPQLERFFGAEEHEPVFVKNLENVQGDERDTILFSIGFGPDAEGRVSMNFGPINQEGGERRLNVAVTRARRRLQVFASLRADQIDLRRTASRGVRDLRAFLDYAQRGPEALGALNAGPGETRPAAATASAWEAGGFEDMLADLLRERGWQVDRRVGCASYRVDLGVRDPKDPQRYLLGIVCDGASYRSGQTARDRDRTRLSVLRGLGWRLERVWSTDWRIHPARSREQLLAALEAAQAQVPVAAPAPVLASAPPVFRSAPSAAPTAAPATAPVADAFEVESAPAAPAPRGPLLAGPPDYRVAQPGAANLRAIRKLDFYEVPNTQRVAVVLTAIVADEGPITRSLAAKRLMQWFEIARQTDKFRQRLDAVIERASAAGAVRAVDEVLWPAGLDPQAYPLFRLPGEGEDAVRDLPEVPPVELRNALVHVVREQVGLPRDVLLRETARLLGAPRLTPRVRETLEAALAEVLATGRLLERGEMISVAGG